MKYWNPYLEKFNVISYVKDQYGIYEALYKINHKGESYLISDKWVSFLWYFNSNFLVVKYSLLKENSMYCKSADYRYEVPFEIFKLDR